MGFKTITYHRKQLHLHKCVVEPDFASRMVLTEDTCEYVEMCLRREHKQDGLFFWQQARNFFAISHSLPKVCSPLTSYYAFLNAAKALLTVKGVRFSERHSVSGNSDGRKTSLANEVVEFKNSGVLAGLCQYFREPTTSGEYTLKDILYNLPCIHRAYGITFKSQPNLFIPVEDCSFVRKEKSDESWFCARVADKRYANQMTLKTLPKCFEREDSQGNEFIIRFKKRFKWAHGGKNGNLSSLSCYHRKIRRHLVYIAGSRSLWYIKRAGNIKGLIDCSPLTLRFAAMHRLSELARYSPESLEKHLQSKHNWLLSEFLTRSSQQYVDEIAAEITGTEIMFPGVRGNDVIRRVTLPSN
jgi:hypothetical protein